MHSLKGSGLLPGPSATCQTESLQSKEGQSGAALGFLALLGRGSPAPYRDIATGGDLKTIDVSSSIRKP